LSESAISVPQPNELATEILNGVAFVPLPSIGMSE